MSKLTVEYNESNKPRYRWLSEPSTIQKIKVDEKIPAFVSDFRSPGLALLAMKMVADFQLAGLSYTAILSYPGFIDLFNEHWRSQGGKRLSVKLKNLVRDLRESKHVYSPEWMNLKAFFEARKRK